VAEHDARAALLHVAEAVEDGERALLVGDDAGQMQIVERLFEIAGIAAEHELTVRRLHTQGLVTGRVAIGGQADDRAVAEDVVLAADLVNVLAGVEIGLVIGAIS
jgi:hypothetical protein